MPMHTTTTVNSTERWQSIRSLKPWGLVAQFARDQNSFVGWARNSWVWMNRNTNIVTGM